MVMILGIGNPTESWNFRGTFRTRHDRGEGGGVGSTLGVGGGSDSIGFGGGLGTGSFVDEVAGLFGVGSRGFWGTQASFFFCCGVADGVVILGLGIGLSEARVSFFFGCVGAGVVTLGFGTGLSAILLSFFFGCAAAGLEVLGFRAELSGTLLSFGFGCGVAGVAVLGCWAGLPGGILFSLCLGCGTTGLVVWGLGTGSFTSFRTCGFSDGSFRCSGCHSGITTAGLGLSAGLGLPEGVVGL